MRHLPTWSDIVFLTSIYSSNPLRNDSCSNFFIPSFLNTRTRIASPQATSVLEMFTTAPAKTVYFFVHESTWRANFCCRLIMELHRHYLKKKPKAKCSTSIPKQPLSKLVLLLENGGGKWSRRKKYLHEGQCLLLLFMEAFFSPLFWLLTRS